MFDPSQPATNSALSSAVMRSQLTSLKALIDAILNLTDAEVAGVTTLNPGDPATASVTVDATTLVFTFGIPRGQEGLPGQDGQDGATGAQGPPFAQAVIDSITTLNPGDPATVTVSFDGTNVHFTFGIPRGSDGATGATGSQGPPFAQAVVDAVNTLNPGESATVGTSFDGSNVHFTFGIPRGDMGTAGAPGENGINGTNGTDGAPGQQGPPGEVTSAQLTIAIATTAQNPSAVTPLSQAADPAYNQAQMQQVMDKLDEFLNATKRS